MMNSVDKTETGCIVLAGGKGMRFGANKVLQIFGTEYLLHRVLARVGCLSSAITIACADEHDDFDIMDHPKLKIISDIYPGKGPLGGIHAGLTASSSYYNLVVASDMPFLNQDLLDYMIRLSAGFDLVIPRLGNFFEPLHAVYSKGCLAPIEVLIRQDNLSILQLLPLVKARYIEAEDIKRFDPRYLSFFNVNTKSDLAIARSLARR
ncbi:MAG: molybdenum cofactor guanylyltransferase [Dehalococcoidales bacterium]